VLEELEEVRSARDDAHRHEEFGDLIFSIAYWADGYKIDIETASRDANQKFARRFRALESTAREQGRAMTEMSEADLLEIWRAVKRAEQQ
jgi:ATP diphosphatase